MIEKYFFKKYPRLQLEQWKNKTEKEKGVRFQEDLTKSERE